MKRVGIGYLMQECNTFSPLATDLTDFGLLTGNELVERWRGTRTEVGGFLDVLRGPGIEAVPLFAGWAITKGRILAGEFTRLKELAADAARRAGALDGILLALHGGMCAEGVDDAEGALLETLRAVTGGIPICLTLDLHANMTNRIASLADVVIGYRTYPHVDMYETGTSAGERLQRILAGEPHPRTVMRKLPMIVPGENMQTASGPMAQIRRYGEGLQRPGILSFSIFGVQAWLDINEMGCAVAAVTIGDEDEARAFCDAVAYRFWELRREFDVALLTPAAAIREALATEGQPVVLSESSDSPTAGSPGDSADMLRALLEHAPGVPSAVWLRDEAAVERAWQAGVGARLSLNLGGAHDRVNRQPVTVEAEVCALTDGRFVMTGSQYTGMQTTMGRAAVLQVGVVTVLVGSLPAPNIDPQLYRSQGIEPRQKKIVVVKSANAFRTEYGPFAVKMRLVDTPGISSANLRSVPYRRVPRPIYPLDEMDRPWVESRRPKGGVRADSPSTRWVES